MRALKEKGLNELWSAEAAGGCARVQQHQQVGERYFGVKVRKLGPAWSSESSSSPSSHSPRGILMLWKNYLFMLVRLPCSYLKVAFLASRALSDTSGCYLKLLLTLQMKELLNRAVFFTFRLVVNVTARQKSNLLACSCCMCSGGDWQASLFQRWWGDPHAVSV